MANKQLYKVSMNKYPLRDFFVVAQDEAAAARAAEKQLNEWNYRSVEAVSVEMIAAGQYGPESVAWLVVE